MRIMKIIDTHTHLYDESFEKDRESVQERALLSHVFSVVNNADSLEVFEKILLLSKKRPSFYHSALGIHPEFANRGEDYLDRAMSFIKDHKEEILAIGEIGLDYHYDKEEETKKKQKEYFVKQIYLAKGLSLPVVVHSRDADRDTFEIIKKELPERVDLHCYSGSWELMQEYLRLPIRFFIGIGGVLTFKNARVIKEVVQKAPLSSLLSETDAPYLAPTPHRGERNEPSYLPLVLKEIARLRGEEEETIANALFENAEEFYGIHF